MSDYQFREVKVNHWVELCPYARQDMKNKTRGNYDPEQFDRRLTKGRATFAH